MKPLPILLVLVCFAVPEVIAQDLCLDLTSSIDRFKRKRAKKETKYELKEGDLVRINILGSRQQYILSSNSADTLIVTRTIGKSSSLQGNIIETHRIAFGDVSTIEVRVRRGTGWGMMVGAGIGFGIGGAVGLIYGIDKWSKLREKETGQLETLAVETLGFIGVIGYGMKGGLIGIPFGAVLGASFRGTRWQRIELTKGLSVGINGNRALSIQYARGF